MKPGVEIDVERREIRNVTFSIPIRIDPTAIVVLKDIAEAREVLGEGCSAFDEAVAYFRQEASYEFGRILGHCIDYWAVP